MTEISLKVLSPEGKETGSLGLDPEVFGAKVNADQVHETVRWQRARARSGTHSTLTKGVMAGGNRKPWKQKGTGRARAGSNTSPVWVGGAVAHGPHPRDYDFRLPKKVRKNALISALSDRASAHALKVIDGFKPSGKTQDMVKLLTKIGVGDSKVLMITPAKDELTMRSANNLANVTILPVTGLNVYDLVDAKFLVTTIEGIEAITRRVKGEE